MKDAFGFEITKHAYRAPWGKNKGKYVGPEKVAKMFADLNRRMGAARRRRLAQVK